MDNDNDEDNDQDLDQDDHHDDEDKDGDNCDNTTLASQWAGGGAACRWPLRRQAEKIMWHAGIAGH